MNIHLHLLTLSLLVALVHATCTPPAYPFTVRRTFSSYPSEESWKIFEGTDDTGILIHEGNGSGISFGDIRDYEACIEFNKQYTLILYDSWGDGWGTSVYPSMIYLRFGDIEFLSSTIPYGTPGPVTVPFTITLPIQPNASYKYINTPQVGTSWTQPSFPDTAWQSLTPGNFPAVASTTRYYRYTTSITSQSNYAITLKVRSNSGLVVYVNGSEVYRVFLPAVSDSNTPSMTVEETETWKSITLPTSNIVTSTVLCIAVEVHSGATQIGSADPFDMLGIFYNNADGTVVGTQGTGVCEPENTNYTEDCENLFDTQLATKYLANTNILPINVTYTLPNNGKTWFNAYQFGSGNDYDTRDPKTWKLYGSNDGTTWEFLDYQDLTNKFPQRKTLYTFFLRSQAKAYHMIKLQIFSTHGASAFQASEFRLLATSNPILAPGIQYETTILNAQINVPFEFNTISSGYYNFAINPPLPDGVFFSTITGKIYGSTSTSGNQSYQVTAFNSAGQVVSTTITINVSACTQPAMASLEIVKKNKAHGRYESFSVFSDMNVSLLESTGVDNGGDQTFNICASAGRLKFVLNQNNGNEGWDSGALLTVKLRRSNSELYTLGKIWLLTGSTATYYINTRLDLPWGSSWNYFPLTTVIDPSWHGLTYPESGWTPYTPGTPVPVTTPVLLLRKTFNLPSKTNMKGWEFHFNTRAGVVIYINNQEVYRRFVPVGEVTSTTTAIGGGQTYYMTSVSGPMKTLNNNLSVTVAIALVEMSASSTYNLEFDGFFRLLGDSNVGFTREGTYSCDGSLFSDGSAAAAFDSSIGSRWITGVHNSVATRWISVVFSDKRAIYANKYCIISNWDAPQHDPVDWTVYGTTDGATWTSLTSQTGISWEERTQRQCFYIPELTQAYLGYKLEVTKAAVVQSENKYALTEFELYIEDIDGLQIPTFSFTPAQVTAYRSIDFPALLVSSEYYHSFTIQPPLPAPLVFDTSNGYITGVPITLQPSTPYQINAVSLKGQSVSTTVYISIVQCQTPNNLFSLTFTFNGGAVEASWTLQDPSGLPIDSRITSISYATQVFSFCKPVGVYTLLLGDTANDGWGGGTFTVSFEDTTVITTGTVAAGESPKTVHFAVGRVVNTGSSIKYLLDGSAPPADWYMPSFSDAAWSTGSAPTFPTPTSTTQYYRIAFQLTSSNFIGMDISAKTYAGMVVYFNGVEIRRHNLPAGTIISSTLATAEFSTYSHVSTMILFNEHPLVANNVIAVELHKLTTIPEVNGFDLVASLVSDNEYMVVSGVPSSDIEKTDNEGYQKLFDNNVATKSLSGPRCVGAIYQWTYNNHKRVPINKYTITNGNDCNQRHPSGWRIEGSNDGNTWTLIDYQQAQMFTSFRQTFTYTAYNPVPYNAYRILTTECQNTPLDTVNCGTGNWQLSEFGLYVQSITQICAAQDGFSAAAYDTYGYKECPANYSGMKRRLCSNGVFQPEQNMCVPDPPSGFSYPSSPYTFHKNIPANVAPVISGNELTFSITPNLPAGLVFSTSSGMITGTPTFSVPVATYNVTATNVSGTVATTIMITVDVVSCSADGLWPMTEVGSQATRSCPDSGYTGTITRLCSLVYPPQWAAEVNTCVLIPPTISYSTNNFIGYKNEPVSLIPSVTGNQITRYSISPSIDGNGITFSTSNGQITGTPTSDFGGSYRITVENGGGSGYFDLTFTIRKVYCPAEDNWPQTERDTTAYNPCVGKSGIQTRMCVNRGSGSASWNTPDITNCYIYDSNENPGENKIFVLANVVLNGVLPSALKTDYASQELLRNMIVQSLSSHSIGSTAVQIVDIGAKSSFYADSAITFFRVLVPEASKDAIVNTLTTFVNNASGGLLSSCQSSTSQLLRQTTSCSVDGQVAFKKNSLGGGIIALIVCFVVIVVVVICVVAFCIFNRMKGRSSSKNGKRLNAKTMNKKKESSAKKSSKTEKATRV